MTAPLMAWWMMLDRARTRSGGEWRPAAQLAVPTQNGPMTPVPRARVDGAWVPPRQSGA